MLDDNPTANINIPSGSQYMSKYPIHMAVEVRSLSMIDLLLKHERGCALKVLYDKDESPLELALKLKEYDIADLIE